MTTWYQSLQDPFTDLGKSKRVQHMAEGTRLNSLLEQIHTLQTQIESLKTTDTIVPKWWDEQKQSIEAKFVENQGYLS